MVDAVNDLVTPHRGVLPLLADPEGYRPCMWDLTAEHEIRRYWLDLFASHISTLGEAAVREEGEAAGPRAERVMEEFQAYLDRLKADPGCLGPLNILEICYERERVLRRHGFADPYRHAKHRENESALRFLPDVLAELDGLPEEPRRRAAIDGVFAGNIFDLGATQTQAMFKDRTVDFHDTREKLKPRPWLVDDLDRWFVRLDGPPHRAAALFVDNAGPDIVLGMIPFARELLKRGTRVILTANTNPSLNDVTIDELHELIDHAAGLDPLIRDARGDGSLQLIASGNGAPLIDLRRLSPELVAAVEREGVDLVVLEGMGRALESNYDAAFVCDALKLCMIKDLGIAGEMGGELFDLVLRFEPAPAG